MNAPLREDWRAAGFGLYVHWPFCLAKCPYCDFNSHVVREIDQAGVRDALLAEMAAAAAETPGRTLDTIFFGGGTPSLMAPETVAAVIAAAGRHWRLAPGAEITLEANPTSVEAGRFRAYREAGVNRLSMGIQSLRDDQLRALGRTHGAAEARAALAIARANFERVSFDLIYGRPHQSLADWQAELAEALELGPSHLSLYQLTIEPGTRFAELHARGRLPGLPTGELGAALYAATQEQCGTAGLPAYEISNHARPGQESRHNLIYWRYGDYVGIGPGAHGRLTRPDGRVATETLRDPAAWAAAVAATGSARAAETRLAPAEQAQEYLIMAIRLAEGADLERFFRLGGRLSADPAGLEAEGLLWRRGGRIGTTGRGRLLTDALLLRLLG
jgi:oxygen-independent coproporphyrinogen-3 oxidase